MASIDEEIKTKFISDRHRLIVNLIFTSNWFRAKFDEYLKPYKISQQQLNILRILRGAKDWVTMNDIKGLMIDRFPNTTRLSDKLLDKELVIRKRSETDRRIVYLKISQQGLDLLKTMDDNNEGEHTKVFERLTDEEAKTFSDLLDRLRG